VTEETEEGEYSSINYTIRKEKEKREKGEEKNKRFT